MVEKRENASPSEIARAVSMYFAVSISLVILNKFVFTYAAVPFPYPLFSTWYQCAASVAAIKVLGHFRNKHPSLAVIPDVVLDPNKLRSVLPLSLLFIGNIALSSMSLRFVEVSFFQVIRSMCVVTGVFLQWWVLGDKPSGSVVVSCFLIVMGFVVGSIGEVSFQMAGFIFGLVSCLFTAMYSIYIKKTLPILDNSTWMVIMYNNVISSIILIPLVLIFEGPQVLFSEESSSLVVWVALTMTGVFGFSMSFVATALVKATSPVTHQVVGATKSCLQTLVSWALFRNVISFLGFCGIAITISGSTLYSYVKHREAEARALAALRAENAPGDPAQKL